MNKIFYRNKIEMHTHNCLTEKEIIKTVLKKKVY